MVLAWHLLEFIIRPEQCDVFNTDPIDPVLRSGIKNDLEIYLRLYEQPIKVQNRENNNKYELNIKFMLHYMYL